MMDSGMRQMVGQRKGAPRVEMPGARQDEPDAPDDSDSDVVECPNCKTVFNEATGNIMTMGAKVEGGGAMDGSQGMDLAGDLNVMAPSKYGGAHDAAYGSAVSGNLLSGLKTALGGR